MGCIVLIVVGDARAYSGTSSRYFGKNSNSHSTTMHMYSGPAQKTNPSKRTPKSTQRIPLRCKHRRGVTRRTTVVCSRARPPEPRPTMAIHNKKDGRILYYIAERHLSKRHLIKYKAY